MVVPLDYAEIYQWLRCNYAVCSKKNLPLTRFQIYFSTTEKFQAIFYMHILSSNIHQTTKFYSVIPNSDKVMPY